MNFLPFLSVFLLSSCVVMPEEYFHPQALGAKIEKASCRGNVGADDRLVYEFDNVNLRLNVWEFKGNTHISLAFRVFNKGTAIWPEQVVNVYSDDLKVNYTPKKFTRLRSTVRDLVDKEYVTGTKMDHTAVTEYETYHDYFTITDKESAQVKIDLIKVIINGKEYSLKDIVFTKKEGWFLHPLNC